MAKQTVIIFASTLFLALLSVGINLAISLKILFSESVIDWVGSSNNPPLALWIISVFFASFVIAMLNLGVKLPFIKVWVERPDHPLFTYILGLPLWVVIFTLVFSGLSLVFLGPVCESPFADIEVVALQEGDIISFDGKSISVKPGARLTLNAVVNSSSVVFCSWSATGSAVKSINPQSSCATQVNIASKTSRGIITLALSKSFCSVKSTNPLEVIVVP